MKNPAFTFAPIHSVTSNTTAPVSIHQLINQLMNSFIPLAVAKKSFIINDVDHTFQLQADEDLLAYVLGNLLSGAINGTKNVCIRVEAVCNNDGVQIRVRNNGAYFYSTVSNGFLHVVQAARQLGGNISIYNQHNEGTTLTFFMGAPKQTFC